ncbi:head-tail connector protein [Allorhizobium pseudoryzae]|uniref:head-tail connector protein n=1 Tax=Allorhizobium pseudoryzae TaxID=379684 RepID=UPI003CFCE192
MLSILTAPEPFSGDTAFVQSVLDHLRIFADLDAATPIKPEDIDLIRTLVDTAASRLDGPHGNLGRCLLEQSWTLTLDGFRPDICLLGPAISVDAVRYKDTSGAWQTLASSAYRLLGKSSWKPELCAAYGTEWPAALSDRETVEIDFTAGYGEVSDVPAPILQAIRLWVAHMYVERQLVTFSNPSEIPFGAAALLSPYKVYR